MDTWIWVGIIFVSLTVGYLLVTRLWFGQRTTIQSSVVNLNEGQAGSVTGLVNPGANSVTVILWMYVNKWPSTAQDVIVFGNGTTTDWKLTLAAGAPKLSLVIGDTSYTCSSNFPMQKWTMVSIVFDTGAMDVYQDSQMVQSFRRQGTTAFNSTQITYGSGIDVALANVRRFPGEAYSQTQIKSEYSRFSNQMSTLKYGVQLSLTKNDQVTSSWTLFG